MTGTTCIDVVDPSRKEVLGEEKGARRITIRFYYPATEDCDERIGKGELKPCELLTENKIKAFCEKPDFTWFRERVRVYENLPVKDDRFPLILYSHGYTECAEYNSNLCQYLAENGFIVAALSHTYEASETVFADGTCVGVDPVVFSNPKPVDDLRRLLKRKMNPAKALEEFKQYQHRNERFLVGRLEEWRQDGLLAIRTIHEMAEDEASFLYQKIDFTHGIGATGHSFGGATAYAHCLFDDEITCGVNMDGGLFGNFGEAVNHKPFMQLLGNRYYNMMTRLFFYHDHPVHFLLFRDLEHLGFTDVKLVSHDSNWVGKADPERTMDTINAAQLAFFDRYLRQADYDNKTPLPVCQEALERYEIL